MTTNKYLYVMKSLIFVFRVSILSFGIVFSSCKIETAKPNTYKKLVIASDYLNVKDSTLFTQFEKESGIRVKIIPLNVHDAEELLLENKNNSGIDVLMVKSMKDVIDLQKKGLFHSLKEGVHFQSKNANYSSEKYNYIGFGYDPYIVATKSGHTHSVRMYNDLTRQKFSTDLSNDELTPLMAPILAKMRRMDANNWVKKFYAMSKRDSIINDSIQNNLPFLTYYSSYINNPSFKKKNCVYPNTKSTGTFYNLRTIAIVQQAENYTSALEFIQFILQPIHNKAINRKLFVVPLESTGLFRKYYLSTEEMIAYYLTVERLNVKLEEK